MHMMDMLTHWMLGAGERIYYEEACGDILRVGCSEKISQKTWCLYGAGVVSLKAFPANSEQVFEAGLALADRKCAAR
jgi:hypothetical protein